MDQNCTDFREQGYGNHFGVSFFFLKKVIIKPKIQLQIYLVMSQELRTVQHSIHRETSQSLKYKFHFKI